MKIKVLSDETINQIAAGEVIERPLSVVKELLENAIDAGSTSVTVEVRDGGIAMIRITDNGGGIDKDDIRTAFLRHATSKIKEARDLENIQTLGFRGEALASIASISRVELISKTPGALMATHYEIEGGVEKDFSEIGAPDGTTFIVRDIFKNVPARRKFLKSPQTEAARIQDILEKEALAHPEVAFRYIQDGRQRLATLGNGSLLDVIYSIYGRDVTNQLITVNRQYQRSQLTGLPAVTVRGFIGKPVITRANRNFEIYFVNSRFVKNPMVTKAIEDGYHAFLMQHKFPFTVLMVDVNPEIVDVNVHPQKLEVRFSDGMLVYNSIVDSVQNSLRETELILNTDLENFGRDENTSRKANIDPHVEIEEKEKTLPHVEPFERNREDTTNRQYEEALRPEIHPEAKPKSDIYLDGKNVAGTGAVNETPEETFRPSGFGTGFMQYENSASASGVSEKSVWSGNAGGGYSRYRRDYAEKHSSEGIGSSVEGAGVAEHNSGFGLSDFKKATDEVEKNYGPVSGENKGFVTASAGNASGETGYTASKSEYNISDFTGDQGTSSNEPDLYQNHDNDEAFVNSGDKQKTPAAKPQQETLFSDKFLSEKARIQHRIIGQVFETYWLIEYDDKLYIIDQHAAHEKVNFERMMKRLKERKPASQYLNPPILVTLTSEEAVLLNEYEEYFQNLGFEISDLGGRDFSISAVPTDLPEIGKKELLLEMLDGLSDETGMTTPDSIYYKIASMSCKAAVKGNNKLSLMEADALISELLELENPYACPHGRPTIISMSKYELEKKFKRIV
ncbi:DNA mismatch repair endonuclease MutL [Oribacterium sp. WCC10]|uniref:DNA mismatch repair endonuclease MutL n=1 Tax=Oribacterium sp. WCC10 TaxID=1855343 RepID=UPI0008EE411B|nr:DNA mismatch repair endonuclease MutL [Oribacterium sp. WCC10]SFG08169.1 DNA mismatch repair protein MutL [Oribacterium sp. WCC10]